MSDSSAPVLYAIQKPLLEALLSYLAGRPYAEVAGAIVQLQMLQPVEQPVAKSDVLAVEA